MDIKINVPDGVSGDWEVSTFNVTEQDCEIFNMRALYHPGGRTIKAGTYKKLTRRGTIVMSNTPAEIRDHLGFIYRARRSNGNILINGLGLGVCLSAILESTTIKTVTVIEKSSDVIALVSPSFANYKRVTIICADAFEWKPPKDIRYDAVWHDIWDNICGDNLPQMSKLHRKYARKTEWQDSWGKALCKRGC
jgi:hypothetical protein